MSRESLLMTVQGDDAEPVVVRADGEVVALVLDDGRRVEVDRAELHAATAPEALSEAA